MYHIAEDKRAQKSAELIGQGMLNLIEKKELSDISISSIYKETGVSRATFYRGFDRVEDVLEYLCDSAFDDMQKKAGGQGCETTRKFLIEFIAEWMKKKALMKCLADNGMMNLLCKTHRKRMSFVTQMIKLEADITESEMDYVCYKICGENP